MEARVAVLEEIAAATKAAIERVDRRMEGLENRIDGFADESRSLRTEMHAEFRALRSEHRADFRMLVGLILSVTGAMLAVMAHGFHWFP